MLPQAFNGHTETGGDGETDMGTVLNVEGSKFLSCDCESIACHEAEASQNPCLMELGILIAAPLFENGERMTSPSDRLTGGADINPFEDGRRSWNQPPVPCIAAEPVQPSDSTPSEQVSVSSDRDAQVAMAARKLYKCCSCGAEFSQSQGLSRHNKDKHEPRNPCRFCASFTWSQGRLYSYKKHLRDKHPGVATHRAQVTTPHVSKKRRLSQDFVAQSTSHKPTRLVE
jgi:DNA-directed RNA polymerase subunit RPC12/RpoP